MGTRVLNRDQFAAYARQQIATADLLLAGHRAFDPAWCACGRPLSCPVAVSLAQTRAQFRQRLEDAEQTEVLPIVQVPPAHHARPRRRPFAFLRRRNRRGDT